VDGTHANSDRLLSAGELVLEGVPDQIEDVVAADGGTGTSGTPLRRAARTKP
jgi:hypothetical protein